MKKELVTIVVLILFVCGVGSANGQSVDTIAASVRKDAKKTFDQGKICHIWHDKDIAVRVDALPFGSNSITIGPFQVIASPKALEPIAYEPAYQIVVKDAVTGISDIQTVSLKYSNIDKATATNITKFSLFVVSESGESKSYGALERDQFLFFWQSPARRRGL